MESYISAPIPQKNTIFCSNTPQVDGFFFFLIYLRTSAVSTGETNTPGFHVQPLIRKVTGSNFSNDTGPLTIYKMNHTKMEAFWILKASILEGRYINLPFLRDHSEVYYDTNITTRSLFLISIFSPPFYLVTKHKLNTQITSKTREQSHTTPQNSHPAAYPYLPRRQLQGHNHLQPKNPPSFQKETRLRSIVNV